MRLDTKNCHLHLNFLNEFDVVPRLDRMYVLSLVDLYRSRFALPPVDSTKGVNASVLFASQSEDEIGNPKVWPLPAPVFIHPGNTILLFLDVTAKDVTDGAGKLRATQINSDVLGSLLFCQVAAHKVAVYLANVEELCAWDSQW